MSGGDGIESSAWKEINDVFQKLQHLNSGARRTRLDDLCRGRKHIRAAVESILRYAEQTGEFLKNPCSSADVGPLLAKSLADLPVGGRIGNYRVTGVLGHGGMGVVYQASQENPERSVALKVIRPGIASKEMLRRFEHEAQMLGRLQHPGIAQIFEAGTADAGFGPQPYFAMELVQGRPMIDYARARQLDTRERLGLLIKVCQAVEHAHQKGIIHRDLKPGNILVSDVGQPKILDFGVARTVDSDMQTTTLQTDIGQLIGTVPYMSPEQVTGDPAALDTRSDVYSLGVLGYELLADRLPYDLSAKTVPEAVCIIRDDEPTPLSSLDRLFRGDLETIVIKSLDKDKERRYQSAAQLEADVRRYLNNEPILARPSSALYQLRKFARRNKTLVGGAAAFFVIISLLLALSVWQWRVARQQADIAAERYRLAFNAGEHMLTQVSQKWIRTMPKMERVRRSLLEETLPFYEALAQGEPGDPTLQVETAKAYFRVAEIRGELGEGDSATQAMQEAIRRFEALVASDPDRASHREMLARCHGLLAFHLSRKHSRIDEAKAQRRREVALYETLVAEFPNNAGYQRQLASGLSALANTLLQQKRYAEAESVHRRGLSLHAALESDAPEDRANLAQSHHWLGAALMRMNQFDEAESHYREAIGLWRTLTEEFQEESWYLGGLAHVEAYLGRLLAETDRLEEGIDARRRAISIRERLATDYPYTVQHHRRLGYLHKELSDLLIAAHRLDEAIEHLRQCIAVREGMAEEFVGWARVVGPQLAENYYALGHLLHQTGQGEQAFTTFRHVIALLDGLRIEEPTEPLHDVRLTRVLTLCPDSRIRDSDRAMALVDELVRRDPASPGYRQLLGIAQHRAGRWPDALATLRDAPEGPLTLFARASIEWHLGRQQAAHEWYQEAIRRLNQRDREDAELLSFQVETACLLMPPSCLVAGQ